MALPATALIRKPELAFLLSATRTALFVFGFFIALAALIALLALVLSVLVSFLIGLTRLFRALSAFSILWHSFPLDR
jgi:hypothetical protein